MEIKQGWTYNPHTCSVWEAETDGHAFWPAGRRWAAEKGAPSFFPTREEALAAMKAAAKELAAQEYQIRLRQIDAAK